MGQSKHKENDALNAAGGPPGSLRPMGFGDRGQGPGGMVPGGRGGPMGRGAGRGNMLEGKRIRITKGFDKGKTGTVKEESETICRVELDATHKRVAVKKTDMQMLDGRSGGLPMRGAYSSGSSGMASGSQTPMWVPSTPSHDGSQTPNPYQDSANTPSTPRSNNYFDPRTPGTPAHEPASSWEAGTPATPGAAYGGASPYEQSAATPATPSGYGGYGGYPTPGQNNPQTPGDPHAQTPHTPATPGGYGGFGGASANTPYDQQSPLPQTPATPGGDHTLRPAAQTSNWCVEKIEVKVVSGEYIDCTGVVTALQGSDCQVKLHDGAVTTVPSEDLEAVPAQKNSSVIILQGELKGNTGKLIGIDGRDGIVKMDLNLDIKIVDMPSLAVYVPG